MQQHIVSVLVDNQPESFARVIGLCSAKGYNISSLLASETDLPSVAQIKIVVNVSDEQALDRMIKCLNRLVVTIAVSREDPGTGQCAPDRRFSLN